MVQDGVKLQHEYVSNEMASKYFIRLIFKGTKEVSVVKRRQNKSSCR